MKLNCSTGVSTSVAGTISVVTLELSCTFQSTNVPVMTSIETNDIHQYTNYYMSSSTLFYLSTDIPELSSESDYDDPTLIEVER
jgi:hypothetical protein